MVFASLLVFLLNLSPAHAATAQNGIIPSNFKEGYYSMGAELTYLTTSANYTDHSTSLDFDGGYGYSEFLSLIYGRFDLSNAISIFSELSLNSASSENPTNTYQAFKAAGAAVGANYSMNLPFIKVVPEFKGYFAIEKYDRGSDEVMTSDGANYFDLGTHIFKTFSPIQLHGYISYEYRTEGFSSLMNYQVDATYKTRDASLTFGAKGFESISDDDNTNNASFRQTYLDEVNGSSMLYAATNPSRTDLFAQAKVSLGDSIDLYGGAAKSIRGKNNGDILTFTVGLEYFFEPLFDRSRNKYRDTVPQDQFQSTDEQEEQQIQKNLRPPPAKKHKPQKKRRKGLFSTQKKIYNPKNTIQSQQPPRKIIRHRPKASEDNELVISRKQMGKTTTSTSPIKSKPKSKKPKRVRVDF